jgi:hypothetical protein
MVVPGWLRSLLYYAIAVSELSRSVPGIGWCDVDMSRGFDIFKQ